MARRLDVSREPDLLEYDLDLPDALVGKATTIPGISPEEAQTKRYAAWQAYLGADRACRLDRTRAQPQLTRARALLSLPSLNCDHIRDPVTIGLP